MDETNIQSKSLCFNESVRSSKSVILNEPQQSSKSLKLSEVHICIIIYALNFLTT